jgi:hypothetical protein
LNPCALNILGFTLNTIETYTLKSRLGRKIITKKGSKVIMKNNIKYNKFNKEEDWKNKMEKKGLKEYYKNIK